MVIRELFSPTFMGTDLGVGCLFGMILWGLMLWPLLILRVIVMISESSRFARTGIAPIWKVMSSSRPSEGTPVQGQPVKRTTVGETLFEAMVANCSKPLEAGNPAQAITDATNNIKIQEEFFKQNPKTVPSLSIYLAQLYGLRAQAHYALGKEPANQEQLTLALQDVEKALSFPEEVYSTGTTRATFETLRENIRQTLG